MPEGSQSALHQGPMGEESPQLSTPLPHTEQEQPHTDSGPECFTRICIDSLDGESERPVSLVSTLSSGSSRDSHSLFGSTAALPSSSTPPIPSEDDINLELSPSQCNGAAEPQSREHWKDVISNQWNNNNCKRKTNGNIMRHLQPPPVITDAMAPNPNLSYVDRVVMEIIETERMYVKDLRSIVEDYLAHIIDTNNLPIRPEQVCALFGNIEDIYEFNSELLQLLDMCQRDPVAIAQCFVDKSESFEIYTQYCNNYPNSVAALTDCMRSKNLAKFFKDRQATLKRSLPLGSYLLKPVQRILKYHLLLQEIAKHFDSDEEGYEVIQEAIETMTGVAWYINDMKRKHEHAVRVQEIQSLLINWKGADLTTYGELVLEGTFHVLRAKNTRALFLFEKMLLITKKRGENYVYKTHILCSTLMLLDSPKDPLLFSVIHFKHPNQPHSVQARSIEEKCLWSQNIKRLIMENHTSIALPKPKEALLDNNYPGKYHYSPERSKKSKHQTEDVHSNLRNGRRRSEPAKQIFRSAKAVLKHADSEGTLLGDRCSLLPASSDSTLASTVDEPLAQRLSVDNFITSRELLCAPECDERLDSHTEAMKDSYKAKEAEDDENEEGEDLMGHDQGDDNAEVPTAPNTLFVEKETQSQESKPEDLAGTDSHMTQVTVEDLRSLDRVSPAKVSHHPEVPYCHTPESVNNSTPEPYNTSQETAEEEGAESDSSSFHVEETSALTNGEMSEEEPEMLAHSAHLLDRASVVSERYIHSISRQSSLISEDLGSVACSSPLTDNEPLMSSSACVDQEKDIHMFCSSPEPLLSSHEPELNDFITEEHPSTLSKQDRLLIHKIRRYYEHAEHQDINFSIKRRESLSYIPAGLVRHMSKQLNSAPQEQASPLHRKELSRNRPTSWSVFDLPGLNRTEDTTTSQETDPMSLSNDNDEVFKPSSEMLKIWEEMDMKEGSNNCQHTMEQPDHLLLQAPHTDHLEISEKNNPECPTVDDITKVKPSSLTVAAEETELDSQQDKGHFSPEYLPKTISFRTCMEEDQILQDIGRVKNKVFHLARQYSQRIKNNRPIKWQKGQETGNQPVLRRMQAVQEEGTTFRENGKPNLRLALNVSTHAVIHEVSSPSPEQTPTPGVNSHSTLMSPHTPQAETFHWPDVQELRSKYTQDTEASSCRVSQNSTAAHTPVGSPLTRGTGSSLKHSTSSDLHKALTDCPRSKSVPAQQGGRCGPEDWPPLKGRSVLCRWNSLDHMLNSHPLHEVQNLQHPVRGLHTTSQLCLASRDTDKYSSERPFHDIGDFDTSAPLSSGKIPESNVKSLRERFQSLSTSS